MHDRIDVKLLRKRVLSSHPTLGCVLFVLEQHLLGTEVKLVRWEADDCKTDGRKTATDRRGYATKDLGKYLAKRMMDECMIVVLE